jgi:transcriptional regulator with XRE-family HTH domain
MNFGQKIRQLRTEANMSQAELARRLGVTERSIHNYEANARYPKGQEVIRRIAETFGVTIDYLLQNDADYAVQDKDASDNRQFLEAAKAQFGLKGQQEAALLLEQTGAMFAGGTLSEEDKDAFFQSITQAYFEAKRAARKKYGRKS